MSSSWSEDHLCSNCFAVLKQCLDDSSAEDIQTAIVDPDERDRTEGDTDSPPLKRLKQEGSTSPCQYCLDILDSSYQQKLIDHVMQHLSNEKYNGLKTFQFCVGIPPSLVMHQGIVEIWLSGAKCKAETKEFLFHFVKDSLKISISKAIESRLNIEQQKTSPFQISLMFSNKETDTFYKSYVKTVVPVKKQKDKRKSRDFVLTQESVQRALKETTLEQLEKAKLLPLPSLYHHCTIEVSSIHEPLFLAGRYNKYSRSLSQTPWVVDGVKKAETSVEELMYDQLLPMVRPNVVRFASSGREDVDVRMLGSGRPFMLEIINPRELEFGDDKCKELETAINISTKDIAVNSLKMVDRKAGDIIKLGEEEKKKHYSALIWSSEPITPETLSFLDNLQDLKINQKTPIRVLHRRALATRERTIHTMKSNYIDSHHFQLELSTQAGTYIKEFVHGDFGRSLPNLCKLMGHSVDIIALDVTDIEVEWPPLNF